MNASSKNRLPGAIGVLIGLAMVGVFAMDGAPPASVTLAQGWLDYASIGRAVGELTGLGFSIALLAFGLKRLATRQVEQRRSPLREASIAGNAAVVAIAVPRCTMTASELDAMSGLRFAPVPAPEAQVLRQRAAAGRAQRSFERRRREEQTAFDRQHTGASDSQSRRGESAAHARASSPGAERRWRSKIRRPPVPGRKRRAQTLHGPDNGFGQAAPDRRLAPSRQRQM
jgi:hypothetical protein